MENSLIYSVSELNTYIKDLLDQDMGLTAVSVEGEISNYKAHSSGHHYFSLKDENSVLHCMMFKNNALRLRFRPQNGMRVVAMGRVEVYLQNGVYQLYVAAMMPAGVGDLQVAFEQLKEKLQKEGLFDPAHKKPLPVYPNKIALVTSPTGAVVRDMLRILRDRWPLAEVCILPVRVQGAEGAGEISRAIAYANAHRMADLIITGRGGGSTEELWCFNEECVARAIYASEIPVISAVGHEPDVTISDLVADFRAGTPSIAAEKAVQNQNDVLGWLEQVGARMRQKTGRELLLARTALKRYATSRALTNPMSLLEDRQILLDAQSQRLRAALNHRLLAEKARFAAAAAKLDALSPLKVLSRGYAIPQKEGKVVTTVKALHPEDTFSLQLQDGTVPCQVLKG